MKYTMQGPRPPRRLTLFLSSALLVLCLTGLLWRLPAPCRASDDEPLSGARASAAPAPDPSTLENVETQITRLTDAYGKLPLGFEANEGQADPEVKFLSRGSGYTIFLTPTGAILRLRIAESKADGETVRGGDGEEEAAPSNVSPSPRLPVSPSAFDSAIRRRSMAPVGVRKIV